MYIDTHAHLNYVERYGDLDTLIARFSTENIVKIINVGCNIPSSQMAIAQAAQYSIIHAACGIHPAYVTEMKADYLNALEQLCNNKRCIALGEIGLDYHYPSIDKKLQQKIFIEQLELAASMQLPILIHARDCYTDMIEILKRKQQLLKKGGIMHCFAGNLQEAESYIDLGLNISFSGTVTFKSNKILQDVASKISLQYLLTETDSPYLAPEPVRGSTNTPCNVKYIYQKLALLREMPITLLQEQIAKNVYRLFPALSS